METIEVTWRSLMKDPPTEGGPFWVYRNECDPVLWKMRPDVTYTGQVESMRSCGFTHWATAVLPKPPEKPEPFERWTDEIAPYKCKVDPNYPLRDGVEFNGRYYPKADLRWLFNEGYRYGQADSKKGTP